MASVDVVIPVLNEEKGLPISIVALSTFLNEHLSNYRWRIVIVDNGSTDNTRQVSEKLAKEHSSVTYRYIPVKGRGLALRTAWLESESDIVSYMDVDLSTNLRAFPHLIAAIENGHDVATGSRLNRESKVKRSFKREMISRSYNIMIRSLFFLSLSDAQCGFKAVSRKAADTIVPLIKDNNWFFDTELLIIAIKRGFRVYEMPVEWSEDPDSRVKVFRTAWEDIKGLMRLRFGGVPRIPNGASLGDN